MKKYKSGPRFGPNAWSWRDNRHTQPETKETDAVPVEVVSTPVEIASSQESLEQKEVIPEQKTEQIVEPVVVAGEKQDTKIVEKKKK